MITYEYGNPEADTVLIQPTGEHELASLENEVREIEKRTSKEFRFIATKVENWNERGSNIPIVTASQFIEEIEDM